MSVQFSIYYLSSHLWLLVVLTLASFCLSDQKFNDVLCINGERQALLQFKHSLIDETDRLASWVGEKNDCCRWAGIVCDNITGHVQEIHLRGLHGHCDGKDLGIFEEEKEKLKHMLGGQLNSSLLELKQLKYLDLSCNDFKQSQIPSFIGSLKNLRYLNLTNSNFAGMIPPQVGNISELRVLSLGNLYGVTMMKMQWLSSLHRLHHLDMSGIDLSKATDWFQVINTLPSLVQLHVSSCNLKDIHSHVHSLNATSLSALDLSNNQFDNTSIPLWVLGHTSLVSLDLSYCYFDEPLPSTIYSFYNLTSLESLKAPRNYVMNSPSVLKALSSKLKLLDISDCRLSSSVLHSLHNLTSLLSLDLSRNELTKAIPNSFGNLCNLRNIDLSDNNFGDIGLSNILKSLFDCKSPSLESLSLSSVVFGPIPIFIERLSSLKVLNLAGNILNGSIPKTIGLLSSLKELNLADNILDGSIPDSIGRLSSLEVLNIQGNQLSGNLPTNVGQLSKLVNLDISYNFLRGVVTEAHFAKLVNLKFLNGERNKLTLRLQQVANWTPAFQLQSLSLKSWSLGPQFPLWLQSQRELTRLDISNTHISSTMPPGSFWRSFQSLTYLDISQNQLEGTLTLVIPPTLVTLDLSSNKLTGKLPSLSHMPAYLNLSSNSFVGSLHHFLCLNGVQETQILYLGDNHLSGVIPECWEKWSRLGILNLENNNLSGEIPRTLGYLSGLFLLNMRGNKISGRLPSSLMNLTDLEILQLDKNELVGSIPPWIGKLSFLRIINLKSNRLDGNIPDELCYLLDTQILVLANNKLSGNIPICFNNFKVLSGLTPKLGQFSIGGFGIDTPTITASDTLTIKGQEYTYKSNLGLMTLLDLSSNNFSGHIPSELTTLGKLTSLNLSRNQLTGRIPQKIGDMEALESLDLSLNKLSGELPTSLSGLHFLSRFNISYNNLTGRVPDSTQLQTFSETSFYGNKLCGAPLSDCVRVEVPANTIDQKVVAKSEWGLIISIVLGFVVGFWIIVAPLVGSTSWRITYFRLMNKLIKV